METVSNERLAQILDKAAGDIKELMHERGDDIQKAWNETIEEEHENEKETLPPLKLGFSVTVDLGKDSVKSAIRFTCAYTSELLSKLPDPNQPELPIDGEEEE